MTQTPSPNARAIREKECRIRRTEAPASWKSPMQWCLVRLLAPATDADCQSAAQQIDNLRYAVADASVTDEAVSADGHSAAWGLKLTA